VEAVQKGGRNFHLSITIADPSMTGGAPLRSLPERGYKQLDDHLAAPEARCSDVPLVWYIRPSFGGLTWPITRS